MIVSPPPPPPPAVSPLQSVFSEFALAPVVPRPIFPLLLTAGGTVPDKLGGHPAFFLPSASDLQPQFLFPSPPPLPAVSGK